MTRDGRVDRVCMGKEGRGKPGVQMVLDTLKGGESHLINMSIQFLYRLDWRSESAALCAPSWHQENMQKMSLTMTICH